MVGHTTKPYKNTLSGSVGAGMGSIFAPGGKKYYILEHKVSSKYHRAGECQEIIVDNITLGRDSHCQVRFDESFKTVSRRHAAIVKDGDMWKLVQISQTNSTFLNGRPIKTEWYLQNGDEIQLSVNGPKLGFIIPTGKIDSRFHWSDPQTQSVQTAGFETLQNGNHCIVVHTCAGCRWIGYMGIYTE